MKKDKRKFSFGGHWTTGSEAGSVHIPVGENEEEMKNKADKAELLLEEYKEGD